MKLLFDGTLDNLQMYGQYMSEKKVISTFSPGCTALKYAFNQFLFASLITLPILFGFSFMMSLIGILEGDLEVMLSMFFGSFGFFLAFYLFIILIVFPVLWGSARKYFKKTRTDMTPDCLDIRFFEKEGVPEQATVIPYEYIKNIRPVSDPEWKNDLGMSNPFRMISNKPKKGHNCRFPKGTPKKNVHVIDLDRIIPVHSYNVQVGGWGRAFPILSLVDTHTLETEHRSNKVFFSVHEDDFTNLKRIFDEIKRKEEEMFKTPPPKEINQPPEIDDSSYMDFFTN